MCQLHKNLTFVKQSNNQCFFSSFVLTQKVTGNSRTHPSCTLVSYKTVKQKPFAGTVP